MIEIRNKSLRGGRLVLSSHTDRAKLAERRESAIRTLIERRELDIVERLRKRQLRIEDVQKGVESGDLDSLRRVNAEPLELGAVLDRSLATVDATLEPSTQRAYRTLDKMLREWKGNDFDIRLLTKAEAEEWLFEAKASNGGEPWSASRQLSMTTLAGRIWNDAIEREREAADLAGTKPRLTRNPWKAIETKAVRKKRAAYLQPAEWQKLLETVRDTPKALAFGLGVLAGLRRGEICHLRIVDADFERDQLHVQPREGEYRWRPKTDRSIRTLDVAPELYELFLRHEQLGFASRHYWIHAEGSDRPLSGVSLGKWAKEGFTAAGLRYGLEGDGLTMHSTRHTFASWLVQNGTSPMVVADLIGDSVQMVIDVYGHLAPRNYRDAMVLVGKIGGGL